MSRDCIALNKYVWIDRLIVRRFPTSNSIQHAAGILTDKDRNVYVVLSVRRSRIRGLLLDACPVFT